MQPTLTETLAQHIANTPFSALPPIEVDAARMSLIDTVGCALAAPGAPGTRAVVDAWSEEGGNAQSTIWATGKRVTARQAAFTNSVFGAALDYDSVFHEGSVHPDIVVVPVAMALAEASGCTGRELLHAIALGNDVLCRLSLATRLPKKAWFFSSTYGVLVAAGITARMLGADATGVAHAMGLASMNAAGTYQPMAERSMSKRALAAFAVGAGIHCGQLGAAGFEGVLAGIEGPNGLFGLYSDGDAARVVDGLGKTFLGASIGRKPFPSCQCNHAPIEAALAIRQELGGVLDEVEEVQVKLSPYAFGLVGSQYHPAEGSQTAAQFSVQYSVACALLHGRVGIAEIQPPTMTDRRLHRVIASVHVLQDEANPNAYVPATVVARLRNGETITKTVDTNRGSAQTPLSRSEMRVKFGDCVSSVFPRLSSHAVDELLCTLEDTDRASDVREIMTRLGQVLFSDSQVASVRPGAPHEQHAI